MDVLSVGCGAGVREIALAVSDRVKSIVGVDIAPHINILNNIVPDEISLKVRFKEGSCFSLPFSDNIFDLVLSHGVIYCIPDSLLKVYFSEMLRVVKPGGTCLVSTAANLPPINKLKIALGKNKKPNSSWKQTGWQRDKKHIISRIQPDIKIERIRNMMHGVPNILKRQGKPNFFGELLLWFSKNIYPFTNSVVAFEIKK